MMLHSGMAIAVSGIGVRVTGIMMAGGFPLPHSLPEPLSAEPSPMMQINLRRLMMAIKPHPAPERIRLI